MSETIQHDVETDGLRIQVVDVGTQRELRFGGTVQSATNLEDPDALVFPYLRHALLGLVVHPKAKSALHLGLGGGTLPAFLHRHSRLKQTVVEFYAPVLDVARGFFAFPQDDERLSVEIADAREWIGAREERFDLIFADTTGLEITPEENDEMLAQLRALLNPGGWVVGNMWCSRLAQRFRPWRRTFKPVVYAGPFQGQANVVILAGTSGEEQLSEKQLCRNIWRLEDALELPIELEPLLDELHLG